MSTRAIVGWILAFTAALASAGVSPAAKCRSKKNQIAGKYSECRQKTEGKLAIDADAAAYATALAKCLARYADKWGKAESAAVAAGGICQTTGDQSSIEGDLAAHTSNVASALAGGPLDACNGALASCEGDLAQCQAAPCAIPSRRLVTGQTTCWNGSGATIPCAGTGQDGAVQAGLSRSFTDNGDGTVTDDRTGLMWEKLSLDSSIHGSGPYTWSEAYSVKIAALNTPPCFASHCDWRLPNVIELQSLTDYGANPPLASAFFNNCSLGCDVLTCSCGVGTWTSTNYLPIAGYAWVVTDGEVAGSLKTLTWSVQAVRGGL